MLTLSNLRSGSLYQPLDPGNGALAQSPGGRSRRPRPRGSYCFFNTQGVGFACVVGTVIVASAVLLVVEADTGRLGVGDLEWTALESDMSLAGVHGKDAVTVESALQEGMRADDKLKHNAAKGAAGFLRMKSLPDRVTPPFATGAYSICEYFLVAFFTVEIAMRLCDQCRAYFQDSWCVLDAAVLAQGYLDLLLPYVVGPEPSSSTLDALAVLRALRALRVLRLFRLTARSKAFAQAFATALGAVMWIGMMVFVLNYITAVLLTALIGQRSAQWDDHSGQIDAWFGSVGRSMQTLFKVMTLSQWDRVAAVVSEVVPPAVVMCFIALHIMICVFTVVSVSAAVVSNSLAVRAREAEAVKQNAVETHRAAVAGALTNAFAACDKSRTGYLTREEFSGALESHPDIWHEMKVLGAAAHAEDLVQLFDRLSQDSDVAGAVRIDSMAEAMTHLSGSAKASEVFDLKYLLLASRREASGQAAAIRNEASKQHKEAVAAAATSEEVAGVKQDVATMQGELAALHQAVAALTEKLGQVTALGEKLEEVSSIQPKLEMLEKREAQTSATQLAALSQISSQLDGFSERFSRQLEEMAEVAQATKLPTTPSKENEESYQPVDPEKESSFLAMEPAAPTDPTTLASATNAFSQGLGLVCPELLQAVEAPLCGEQQQGPPEFGLPELHPEVAEPPAPKPRGGLAAAPDAAVDVSVSTSVLPWEDMEWANSDAFAGLAHGMDLDASIVVATEDPDEKLGTKKQEVEVEGAIEDPEEPESTTCLKAGSNNNGAQIRKEAEPEGSVPCKPELGNELCLSEFSLSTYTLG